MGAAFNLESGGGPDTLEREPVDFSDARGWELTTALTSLAVENFIAAFDVVTRDDPHFEYLEANVLQVLADWRQSLLCVPVFLRRMADPQVSHKDLPSSYFPKAILTCRYGETPKTSAKKIIQDIQAYPAALPGA